MSTLLNIDPMQSQPNSNMCLVDLRLILKFLQNKDPGIAKRIQEKKQIGGFRDAVYKVCPEKVKPLLI